MEETNMIKKRRSKRNVAIILTSVLSIAMASTVMAAPGGPGGNAGPSGNGGPGGRAGLQGGFEQRGQMPSFEEGERPELPTFEEGERPEPPEFDGSDKPEPPEGQMTETEDEDRPEPPEGEMPKRPEMKDGREMKGIDTDSIQTAIEDLDDEDVKADLETLLAEYTEAKSALDSAIESESEDIDTYRKAEMDAMKALREALDEAGIDTRPELPEGEDGERPEFDNDLGQTGRQIIREDLNGMRQNDQIPSNSEKSELINRNKTGSESSSDTTFNKFVKWLESLFS
jgi:hypothetical protein